MTIDEAIKQAVAQMLVPLTQRLDAVEQLLAAAAPPVPTPPAPAKPPWDKGYHLAPDESHGLDLIGKSNNLIGGTSARSFNWALGEWRDPAVTGAKLIGHVDVVDLDAQQIVAIDATSLVDFWCAHPDQNWGAMLTVSGAGAIQIGTRQTGSPAQLGGTAVDVDVQLSRSSVSPTGSLPHPITVDSEMGALLYWRQPASARDSLLQITCTGQWAYTENRTVRLQLWQVGNPQEPRALDPLPELDDRLLRFHTDFEGVAGSQRPAWAQGCSLYMIGDDRAATVSRDLSGPPEMPRASGLRMSFPEGANLSNDLVYPCTIAWPLAMPGNQWRGAQWACVEYDVWWSSHHWSDCGKLIGFTGQLDHAGARLTFRPNGNSGAKADATGWTMRGLVTATPHNIVPPVRALGVYAYHQGQAGHYGDIWTTAGSEAGVLAPGRWYRVRYELAMNTPGKADGKAAMWIDGSLVLLKEGIAIRAASVDPRLRAPALPGSDHDGGIVAVILSPEYGGKGTVPPGEGGYCVVTGLRIWARYDDA